MISDVLADAIVEMDDYLSNRLYDDTYTGDLRTRILQVRAEMELLRIELDAPPER